MIPVTNLKAGTFFEDKEEIFEVLAYEHTKMGRGSGNIKVKVRNLENGAQINKSFITGAQVQEVLPQKKKAQFLYSDESYLHFMDTGNYEQLQIPKSLLLGQEKFIKEGIEVAVLALSDKVLSVDLPKILEYKVTQTGPAYKGNSVTNVYKPAILENGLEVKVPIFIKDGEIVRVDTRSGEYVERAR